MGRKNKRARWADLEQMDFVFQPSIDEVFEKDFYLKGKWNTFFGNDHPIILELGCGKGEYTVGLAATSPKQNFIGVDIKGARMWRGAMMAKDQKLDNVAFVRTRIEWINSLFGPAEITEIWLTFPDPQLKKRRAKKRLTHPVFLNRYRTMLKPGGIIHLKTDNPFLYNFTREVIRFNNLNMIADTNNLYKDLSNHAAAKIQTFYERMFLEQGLNIHYLSFTLPENKPIEDLPEDYGEE